MQLSNEDGSKNVKAEELDEECQKNPWRSSTNLYKTVNNFLMEPVGQDSVKITLTSSDVYSKDFWQNFLKDREYGWFPVVPFPSFSSHFTTPPLTCPFPYGNLLLLITPMYSKFCVTSFFV